MHGILRRRTAFQGRPRCSLRRTCSSVAPSTYRWSHSQILRRGLLVCTVAQCGRSKSRRARRYADPGTNESDKSGPPHLEARFVRSSGRTPNTGRRRAGASSSLAYRTGARTRKVDRRGPLLRSWRRSSLRAVPEKLEVDLLLEYVTTDSKARGAGALPPQSQRRASAGKG